MVRKGQADEIAKRQLAKSALDPAGDKKKILKVKKERKRKRRTPYRVARQIFKEQKHSQKNVFSKRGFNQILKDCIKKYAPEGMRIAHDVLPMLREAAQDYAIETLHWANERGPVMRNQQTLTAPDLAAERKQQTQWLLKVQHVAK